jgi:hypothetical protein
MSSTCSDPACPMNAPAFIRHGSLRPASRDLSGGARSGNANQITPHMKQASTQTIQLTGLSYLPPDPRPISSRLGNQRDSIGPGLEHDHLRSHLEASRQNLLFTMYQNRHRAEAMCNLCISPKDNVRVSQTRQFGTPGRESDQERSAKPPRMVELIGIEPMTPCLQSRCSPS